MTHLLLNSLGGLSFAVPRQAARDSFNNAESKTTPTREKIDYNR